MEPYSKFSLLMDDDRCQLVYYDRETVVEAVLDCSYNSRDSQYLLKKLLELGVLPIIQVERAGNKRFEIPME